MSTNTPPVTPLPVAVELADSISQQNGCDPFDWSGAVELIDARIREHQMGLVEALKSVRGYISSVAYPESGINCACPMCCDSLNKATGIIDAALRSAGAE